MIDLEFLEPFYEAITEECLKHFREDKLIDIFELAERLMSLPDLPMHCPPHHYLVPAVLLTACHKAEGGTLQELLQDLEEANERAHHVLAGFCGLYGDCGAAVGTGIFLSIYTQTGPCSGNSWAWSNKITARALMDIAEIDGPRCCKRNTYLALLSACDTIREYLDIDLKKPEAIRCTFYERNKECKGIECPFWKGAADSETY